MAQSLSAHWQAFEALVLADASDLERALYKRAFYTGALSALDAVYGLVPPIDPVLSVGKQREGDR